MAAVGERLIDSMTKLMIQRFFENLAEEAAAG
jgi:carbon monoxide dehydrogenase subunit G